jgi:anti-sigma B factor antagonist
MILDVETRQVEPGITIFELIGRLTLGNRLTEVEHQIKDTIAQGCCKLVLDLKRLEFLDSAGVGMLVMCAGLMEQAGGQVRITAPNSRIMHVFEITHIGRVIPILEDSASACQSFPTAAAS